MPKKVAIALFDMDGTIADHDESLRRGMAPLRAKGEPLVYDRSWDKVPHLRARRHLVMSQPGFYRNLSPIQAGLRLLRETQKIGFCVHILTKGPMYAPNAWTEKLEWCQRYVPGIPLTITQNKELVYGRVLVDDWPPYLERWLAARPRGIAIVPSRPWNKDFSHARAFRYAENDKSLHSVLRVLRDQYEAT